jgi:hypothetical protein
MFSIFPARNAPLIIFYLPLDFWNRLTAIPTARITQAG